MMRRSPPDPGRPGRAPPPAIAGATEKWRGRARVEREREGRRGEGGAQGGGARWGGVREEWWIRVSFMYIYLEHLLGWDGLGFLTKADLYKVNASKNTTINRGIHVTFEYLC